MTIYTGPATLRRISEGANLAANSLLEISQMYSVGEDGLLIDPIDCYPYAAPPSLEREESQVEEELCSDFVCCGLSLPDLHALLRHYEESHVRVEDDQAFQQQQYYHHNHHNQNNPQMLSGITALGGGTHPTVTTPLWPEEERLSAFDTTVYRPLRGPSHYNSATTATGNQQSILNAPRPQMYAHQSLANNIVPSLPVTTSYSSTPMMRRARSAPLTLNLATDISAINTLKAMLPPALSNVSDDSSLQLIRTALSSTLNPPPRSHLGLSAERVKKMRPYICKVPGCGKTYKNANGLKYHTLHGHDTPGKENGITGEKPHRCPHPTCGKRYKNSNGLKYHVQHAHGPPMSVSMMPQGHFPFSMHGQPVVTTTLISPLSTTSSSVASTAITSSSLTSPSSTSKSTSTATSMSPSLAADTSTTTSRSNALSDLARIEAALKRERALRVQMGLMSPNSDEVNHSL